MKTKEELDALKKEYQAVNEKLMELSDDELKAVTGGFFLGNQLKFDFEIKDGEKWYEPKIYIDPDPKKRVF